MKQKNFLLKVYNSRIINSHYHNRLKSLLALLSVIALSIFNSHAVDVVVPFTTTGAQTWTCPAGVTSITVECWGGGGAGGGTRFSGTANSAFGGGGSGGGYAKSVLTVIPGTTYNLSVGAGGVGTVPSSDNQVAAGGAASYFNNNTTVKANGGIGGTRRWLKTSGSIEGSGGIFISTEQYGTIFNNGGNGGTADAVTNKSGSGGGSAGTGTVSYANNGNNGSASTAVDGTLAVVGGGAGGRGVNAVNQNFPGTQPGGGGGGSKAGGTVTLSQKGGDGGAGQITITYILPVPTITSTPTTLSDFSYVYESGPSASKSVSLTGEFLTGATANLTVTAPTNYEVSLDNTTFSSSVLVEYTSATLAATTIHVRLKAGLSGGNYNSENISITGGGLSTAYTITCSGGVSDTYTWVGGSTDAQVASNWSPSRSATVAGDVLQFNTGGSVTITNVPTQTLSQLLVSNNTAVELEASANAVISISGGDGTDLIVPTGSSLTLNGSDYTIKINLATGATGTIGGNVTFTGTNDAKGLNHQITAADADAIHVTSGGVVTGGTNFTGSPLGTSTNGSVIFESGSTYVHGSGSTPFGGINVVTFEAGSLYKFTGIVGGIAPAAVTARPTGGKSYANYEIAVATFFSNANPSANGTYENMVINGTSFSISGNTSGATTTIKGDVTIGTDGGVTFGNGTAVSPVIFGGSSLQTITLTDNGLFTIGAGSVMSVNNDLTLDGDMTFNGTVNVAAGKKLTIAAGKKLTMGAGSTLTIASGATLDIASGATLELDATAKLNNDGTMTNNGTLNLLSSASGNATLVSMGTMDGSGTSNVNQYLSNTPALRSWYLSTPVVSASPADMALIKTWDEPTYAWSSTSLSSMAKFKGYLVNPTSGITNIEFSGALNNGDLNIPLTSRTGTADKAGFNLIGNPYPCYLDWDLVTDVPANLNAMRSSTMWYRTKIDGAYSFWTVNGDGVGAPNDASKDIPPMQAFWVRAISGGGNLALTTNMLSHGPDTDKLLKAPAATKTAMTLIRLQVSNGTNTDEAVIYFSDNAANEMDKYDAPKMSNDNVAIPEIYTTLGTEHIVINAMNSIQLDTPIGVGFVAGSATSFSIKANELSNLPSDVKVILIDNANNGQETDLTDGTAVYTFEPAQSSADRFTVIFRSTGATTGLENAVDNSLFVFSNANRQIVLNCNNDLNLGSVVSVYNAVGQKLMSKEITSNQMIVANELTAGVYVVKVNNITKKITIK